MLREEAKKPFVSGGDESLVRQVQQKEGVLFG
jgi:hypothetical protein